jgi:hypothetical protein
LDKYFAGIKKYIQFLYMDYFRCKDCQNYVGTIYEMIDHKIKYHKGSVCDKCGIDNSIYSMLLTLFSEGHTPQKSKRCRRKNEVTSTNNTGTQNNDTPSQEERVNNVVDEFANKTLKRTSQLCDDKKTPKYITFAQLYIKFQEYLEKNGMPPNNGVPQIDRRQMENRLKTQYGWALYRKLCSPVYALFGVEYVQ